MDSRRATVAESEFGSRQEKDLRTLNSIDASKGPALKAGLPPSVFQLKVLSGTSPEASEEVLMFPPPPDV